MSRREFSLEENAEKTLKLINSALPKKLEENVLINSVIAFTGFMFLCAHEDKLFRKNLESVMGIDDFRKFLTGEPNAI